MSPEVRTALDAFRAKDVEGRAYLVLSYEGKNVLKVQAQGVGFIDEAVAHLPDGECRYVYLRTEHQVEAAKVRQPTACSVSVRTGICNALIAHF